MLIFSMDPSARRSLSQLEKSRRFALECLRLASDCTQLARAADNALFQQYFRQAAAEWIALAASELPPQVPAICAPRAANAGVAKGRHPEHARPKGMSLSRDLRHYTRVSRTIH